MDVSVCMLFFMTKVLLKKYLEEFGTSKSILGGHPEHFIPGVEFSTGALGHGYPIASGVAKALRLKKKII